MIRNKIPKFESTIWPVYNRNKYCLKGHPTKELVKGKISTPFC